MSSLTWAVDPRDTPEPIRLSDNPEHAKRIRTLLAKSGGAGAVVRSFAAAAEDPKWRDELVADLGRPVEDLIEEAAEMRREERGGDE